MAEQPKAPPQAQHPAHQAPKADVNNTAFEAERINEKGVNEIRNFTPEDWEKRDLAEGWTRLAERRYAK